MHRIMDPQERDFYTALGQAVRTARETKGWSRPTLGDKVGLSAASIQFIEEGKTRPVLHQYVMLVALLDKELGWGIKISFLVNYKPRPRRNRAGEKLMALTPPSIR